MKMVKLTKTSWGVIRKNLCFLIHNSNNGAHVGMGSSPDSVPHFTPHHE